MPKKPEESPSKLLYPHLAGTRILLIEENGMYRMLSELLRNAKSDLLYHGTFPMDGQGNPINLYRYMTHFRIQAAVVNPAYGDNLKHELVEAHEHGKIVVVIDSGTKPNQLSEKKNFILQGIPVVDRTSPVMEMSLLKILNQSFARKGMTKARTTQPSHS